MFKERDPVSLGLRGGGEGLGGGWSPGPRCAGSGGAPVATLYQPPLHTLRTPTSAASAPGRLAPSPSSATRMNPMKFVQAHGIADKPYLPSSLRSSEGQTG